MTIENEIEFRVEKHQENIGGRICLNCGKRPLFILHSHAVCKGHIYSELGRTEFGISQLCEFCFDEITAEPEDEDYDDGFKEAYNRDLEEQALGRPLFPNEY
jgi:hypothetical protein